MGAVLLLNQDMGLEITPETLRLSGGELSRNECKKSNTILKEFRYRT